MNHSHETSHNFTFAGPKNICHLRFLLSKADLSRSGEIKYREFSSIMRKMGVSMTDEDLKRVFHSNAGPSRHK
jgi:Ca2+-binding EF-hand superfamily protein